MPLKSFIALLCLYCLAQSVSAQHITISGYISDKKSGERLTGAVVFIPQLQAGAAGNTFGFYSITIPAGTDSVEIKASYVGYNTIVQKIAASQNLVLNIELPEISQLGEVVITSARKDAIQEKTQMSAIDMPVQTIKSLPAFMGEPDIMKAIQLE